MPNSSRLTTATTRQGHTGCHETTTKPPKGDRLRWHSAHLGTDATIQCSHRRGQCRCNVVCAPLQRGERWRAMGVRFTQQSTTARVLAGHWNRPRMWSTPVSSGRKPQHETFVSASCVPPMPARHTPVRISTTRSSTRLGGRAAATTTTTASSCEHKAQRLSYASAGVAGTTFLALFQRGAHKVREHPLQYLLPFLASGYSSL